MEKKKNNNNFVEIMCKVFLAKLHANLFKKKE